MTDKPLTHLTHFDLDGAVSEIILKKYLNIKKSYACGYGKFDKWINDLKSGDQVIVSDVNLTEEQVQNIVNRTGEKSFVIIDHHPSTENLTKLYPENVIYSGDFCGAALCFRYVSSFFPNAPCECLSNGHRKMLELTDIYDNWKTDHKNWGEAYALNILYWHLGHWDFVKQFADNFSLTEEDKEVIKQKLKEKSVLIKNADIIAEDEDIIIVMCDRDITNDFTLVRPNHSLYLMIGWDSRSSEFSLSVRSKDPNINLTQILKEIRLVQYDSSGSIKSAGGHRAAGGVYFNENVTLDEIMIVCKTITDIWREDVIPF